MKKITTILFFVFSLATQAQDIHFSQFYNAPLNLNPANTGAFDGNYRFGANYREQWKSVTVPYKTFSAWADFSLISRHHRRSFPSFGLVIDRDKAGDGNLSTTKVMGSFAYHTALDRHRYHMLAVGVQFGAIQKSIDWQFLYFNNQWNDQKFDNAIPNNEPYTKEKISYTDIELGANFSSEVDKTFNWYAGLSTYHLIKPQESFYSNINHLGVRPVFNGGANFKASRNIYVHPSFEYMNQKNASEMLVGSLASYNLEYVGNGYDKVFAGIFYRVKDAIIPVVGYQMNNWKLTMNYDVNVSQLKPFSHGRGAIEISIIYIGAMSKQTHTLTMPCPRF